MPRGWRNDPPRDDEEARERIISATLRCVDRHGLSKTGISDVATELGITRQTVYRHFASTDELFLAVGASVAGDLLKRLSEHLAGRTDPVETMVEGIAWCIEELPQDPYIWGMLTLDDSRRFIHVVTSPDSADVGQAIVGTMDVDWDGHGYSPADRNAVVAYGLRVVQSLILDPLPGVAGGPDLRATLGRWVAPAIRSAGDHRT